MSQTHRKTDTFGIKKLQREQKRIKKRLKKVKKQSAKQLNERLVYLQEMEDKCL